MARRARRATIAAVLFGGIALGAVGTYLLSHPTAREDHGPRTVETDGHDGHDDGSHDDTVRLSTEQLAALELETFRVRMDSLDATVALPGEVQWNADRLVHVTPRVGGVVESVEKTLGDTVEEGELLCVLDSREMASARMAYLSAVGQFAVAEADFERSRAVHDNTKKLLDILDRSPSSEEALAAAAGLAVGENKNKLLTTYTRMQVQRRNLERTERMLEKRVASEVDFLEAQGAYDIARADHISTREEITFDLGLAFLRAQRDFELARTELENTERSLQILGSTDDEITRLRERIHDASLSISRHAIRSTLAGIVVDRHLTTGEVVRTESELYTVADPTEVWVIGRVYERDVRFLRLGQKAVVRLDAFPGELFEGSIDYLGSQLDPGTRSVEARVVLANPERRLRPGMFGAVTVFTEHAHQGPVHQKAFLVPMAAVQRLRDGFVVYRQLEPGRYRQVPVQVVAQSKEFAEVTGALEEGALVVTGETFVLKSEASKEAMGAGHAH